MALTNIKVAIFRGMCHEDKVKGDYQKCKLEELRRMLRGSPIGELQHLKSYRLEGGVPTNSLVND
jgi:hypothetical protein